MMPAVAWVGPRPIETWSVDELPQLQRCPRPELSLLWRVRHGAGAPGARWRPAPAACSLVGSSSATDGGAASAASLRAATSAHVCTATACDGTATDGRAAASDVRRAADAGAARSSGDVCAAAAHASSSSDGCTTTTDARSSTDVSASNHGCAAAPDGRTADGAPLPGGRSPSASGDGGTSSGCTEDDPATHGAPGRPRDGCAAADALRSPSSVDGAAEAPRCHSTITACHGSSGDGAPGTSSDGRSASASRCGAACRRAACRGAVRSGAAVHGPTSRRSRQRSRPPTRASAAGRPPGVRRTPRRSTGV